MSNLVSHQKKEYFLLEDLHGFAPDPLTMDFHILAISISTSEGKDGPEHGVTLLPDCHRLNVYTPVSILQKKLDLQPQKRLA